MEHTEMCVQAQPKCLCNKCKHDSEECCINRAVLCPVEKCTYFEREDENGTVE